ncbi:tetratricopeptide repeat protein [Sphingomonas japonica]|uniref:Tetratricopeptide (TPR) repeat protein n=1 Tax=Sphingomonas japonica TaxID=511662 RepID=A0ABX0TZD9_9SPHN|nr:tetratricopeptide repeat protein [Sphingomonas japonica]NIJ23684.1 tetratricopeptide (TPR) repeat protein [Sphingomonas japonica]
MILPLILLQTLATPVSDESKRHQACVDLAISNPAAALAETTEWQLAGGGALARQCLGVAFATQAKWPAAAVAFEDAARTAERAGDRRAGTFWAQAGNAWLAGGDTARARAALDTAIGSGQLAEFALGEAHLDRARTLVAAGDPGTARTDLDRALQFAPADPLAWLLSATLARRQGDLPRARTDIAQALKRSPDDASVQLEAGNIAVFGNDVAAARTAWEEVQRLAPGSPQAKSAEAALQGLPVE